MHRARGTSQRSAVSQTMPMAFDGISETSDEDLLARFADGDQSAARALTMRLAPGSLALARRLLGDEAEAEDVAQEAMLRLWKIAPDWEAGRAKPSTWLYRVTLNLCRDRLRKSGRFDTDQEMDTFMDDRPTVEEDMIRAGRATAVRTAVDGLPDRQRTAIHLRHFEEMSNIEIAEVMETSVEAVESLLGRAKRRLATLLLAHVTET